MSIRYIIYIFWGLFFCFSCNKSDSNSIYLEQIDLDKENRIRLQTIEEYKDKGIKLIKLDRLYGIDDFKTNYIFIKEKGNTQLIYQVENINNKTDVVVSKDYFAFVKPYNDYKNYGWFFLERGEERKLPFLDNFIDSLESIYSHNFIKEINGYIELYQNGKIEKILNYGNFILKDDNLDNLEYGLYKGDNNHIMLVSESGNDLKNQQNGLFFVPSPGYGVIAKYAIKDIINTIDSVSDLESPPKSIRIK